MSLTATAVMIAFDTGELDCEDNCLGRLDGLLTALRHCGFQAREAQVIVIDNSPRRSERIANAVIDNGTFEANYWWQDGANLMYGPSLNLAVSIAKHPYLLYICANHGHAVDPTWPVDLLAPLIADEQVAMTGCLQPSGPPESLGFPADMPPVHVQGGVHAARVDVLRRYPYPDGELAHWGSDVYQSLRLMAVGFKLVDVPTIRSVWREDPGEGNWKYVHGT